ncbi:NYN domain-containing protein [Amycolatopsis sp. NPDC054798]
MTTVTIPGNTDQAAVFIDFENLAIGAANSLPDQDNPVPYAALELVCRDYGNASIRRAYADWAKPQFGKYQQDLAMNGVDLIQLHRFGIQQKNAADIRLAVDAMETLITHPDIGTYLLVAGGSDYSPLVQRLREFGKHVVGVGRLISVVDLIDDSPQGRFNYTIQAGLAQLYSDNLAQEVIKGFSEKTRAGGTPYRAPVGYLNKRRFEGVADIRWVEVDPVRGPLVSWAFEEYAGGEWSVIRLLDALDAKGMTNSNGRLLSNNGLYTILTTRTTPASCRSRALTTKERTSR